MGLYIPLSTQTYDNALTKANCKIIQRSKNEESRL